MRRELFSLHRKKQMNRGGEKTTRVGWKNVERGGESEEKRRQQRRRLRRSLTSKRKSSQRVRVSEREVEREKKRGNFVRSRSSSSLK
mgnify:CR=1 FL=1